MRWYRRARWWRERRSRGMMLYATYPCIEGARGRSRRSRNRPGQTTCLYRWCSTRGHCTFEKISRCSAPAQALVVLVRVNDVGNGASIMRPSGCCSLHQKHRSTRLRRRNTWVTQTNRNDGSVTAGSLPVTVIAPLQNAHPKRWSQRRLYLWWPSYAFLVVTRLEFRPWNLSSHCHSRMPIAGSSCARRG